MVKIATKIELDRKTGEVSFDGTPSGYYIAEEPISVTVDPRGGTIVRLPFLAESFTDKPMPASPPSDDEWLNPPKEKP